ncbi:MAG: methylmalonyl-CoA epimerase [Proteobacteria bacterium]|nr:methylmalonyl-CoA epimerase [Pseudomonadota bacterium]
MNLPLDHIGIATHNLDTAIAEYQRLFSLTVQHREKLADKQIELCFLDLGNTRLELLAPTAPESTISKFLQTRGPGLHHVCYKVEDIKSELARLKGLGVKLIDEVPRPGAHGTQIAFLHPSSFGGVLTELCEYQP